MAPKKKTPTMIWVRKSQQPGNIAKPEATKKDFSPLREEVSKLQLSSSSSATKEDATYVPGWSHLPEELLQIISEKLDDCFDIIHARSVCRPWRSTFRFPWSSLLRTRYSLPSFEKFPRKSKGSCTLEKFPMFLFRVRANPALPSEFYIGGIEQDKSDDHVERPSPVQCSVKVKVAGSDPTFMNILDCQILPLGYQYRMIGYDPNSLATSFTGVGCLPLNKGYVVLIGYSNILLALRSSEMRWTQLERTSRAQCKDIVIFRGKFYVVFLNGDVFVIDPYSLEGTPLMPSERLSSQNDLVPYGNEELFLVERIIVRGTGVVDFGKLPCRVSRLDVEAGEWVVINELGNRVLLIGQPGNSSCSGKELPDGCGVSGDSVLFTNDLFGGTFPYKYGVETGNAEDDLSLWRYSRKTDVTILSTSPMVTLRIEAKRFPSSSANMTEPVTENKTSSSSMLPDWSLLPEELLHIVSTHLEDCFDVVHARSVCSTWRSTFPFPSVLLRPSYSLPAFAKFPKVSKDLCTLEKIPLFLFRPKVPSLATDVLASQYSWEGMGGDILASEYFLGGIGQDESENQIEFPSPIQCSVKVKIPSTDLTMIKMNDCQILPLGHQYRMRGWNPEKWATKYSVAFLPLNMEKGEFIVLLNYNNVLLVLRSTDMRWMRVEEASNASCRDLMAYKGRFYVTYLGGAVFVYDPNSLIGTPLMPSQPLTFRASRHLVRSGDDDVLFLVEKFNPYPNAEVLDFGRLACRVSILDEEAGDWVEVSDLGDRVFFIGHYGNVSCSASELPSGCGLSGNSIVSTGMGPVTYAYKYGVDTGDENDELTWWRFLRVNRVNCLMTSPVVPDRVNRAKQLSPSPVLVLRVEL